MRGGFFTPKPWIKGVPGITHLGPKLSGYVIPQHEFLVDEHIHVLHCDVIVPCVNVV